MTIKFSDGPTLRSIWEAQIQLAQWVIRKLKNKIKEENEVGGQGGGCIQKELQGEGEVI